MISRQVLASFLLAVCLIGQIGCPPVVPEEKPKDEHNNNEEKPDVDDPVRMNHISDKRRIRTFTSQKF